VFVVTDDGEDAADLDAIAAAPEHVRELLGMVERLRAVAAAARDYVSAPSKAHAEYEHYNTKDALDALMIALDALDKSAGDHRGDEPAPE
jgi:hypothetical protein